MMVYLDSANKKISHVNSDGLEKTLYQHIKEIKEISNLILNKHFLGCKECTELINILAEKHDIGKLNPTWNVYDKRRPPHSALSAYLYLMDNENYDPLIFYLIWRHHSALKAPPYTPSKIQDNFIRYLKHPEIKVNRNIQQRLYNIIKNEILKRSKNEENYPINVLYSDLFGVFKTADILSAKFEVKLDALKQNLKKDFEEIKNLLKKYVVSKGLEFDEEKWKKWIDLATFKNENLILLAPTGWGKTFAALTIAFAHKPTHIIYVLPTITAIRKMKETLNAIFDDIDIVENYFFTDAEIFKCIEREVNDENLFTELFIAKSFLAPITITTLDQILLSFLNVGKYHMKRYHFRNSFIIFDEYHLYPPNGLILLLNFLKIFNDNFRYNMRFIFMSATEDPIYTNLITSNIKNIKRFAFLEEYKKLRRYKYNILEWDILKDEVINLIKERSKESKVLVVVNTVEKAIKLYLTLRNQAANVLLLHSRFIYKDRRNKEELLEKFDKNEKPLIFIATQLAEVSLDMSFDYLFTELAPLPSLIQRFGRVNRYGDHTDKENVFITYPSEIENNKSFYPYEKDHLEKSYNILMQLEKNHNDEYDLITSILMDDYLKGDFDNRISEITKYFDKWIKNTGFIYTVDLGDEQMNKILKFRETYTTLVIPKCKEREASDLLSTDSKIKNTLIKNLLVPVPVGWLWQDKDNLGQIHNIPVLGGSKYVYSSIIGYFDSEKINVPKDIPLCVVDSTNII